MITERSSFSGKWNWTYKQRTYLASCEISWYHSIWMSWWLCLSDIHLSSSYIVSDMIHNDHHVSFRCCAAMSQFVYTLLLAAIWSWWLLTDKQGSWSLYSNQLMSHRRTMIMVEKMAWSSAEHTIAECMAKNRSFKNSRVTPATRLSNIDKSKLDIAVADGHQIERVEVFVIVVFWPSICWSLNTDMLPINCSQTVREIPLLFKTTKNPVESTFYVRQRFLIALWTHREPMACHSSGVDGRVRYCGISSVHIAAQVSYTIPATVLLPNLQWYLMTEKEAPSARWCRVMANRISAGIASRILVSCFWILHPEHINNK